MPTYQYACTACDERLEAVQSFTDAPLTECPACGGALRKVYSAVGVVFKGSGFYKTDSRAKSPSDSGGSDTSKPDSTADTKADTKGDAKPDTKPGAKPAAASGDKAGSTSSKPATSSSSSSSSSSSAPVSKSA